MRLHPSLGQFYRQKVEKLHAVLQDPAIHDEAVQILQGLIDRVVIHPAADGLEVELVGKIARMVELGVQCRTPKKAALDERTACSVKVVAGTRNQRYLPRLACRVPRSG